MQLVKVDVAVGLAILNPKFYFLDNVARRVQQVYVEDTAQVGLALHIFTHDIRLEPNALAHEVACVVEVQVYLLLRETLGKLLDVADEALQLALCSCLRRYAHWRQDQK